MTQDTGRPLVVIQNFAAESTTKLLDETLLAAQIMDAWATAELIDGNASGLQGDEDPEWWKIKLAIRIVRQSDGSAS